VREVSCRACAPIVEIVRRTGRSAESLVEGLGIRLEDACLPANRIDWDAFVELLERAARLLGGVEHVEREAVAYGASMDTLRALAANAVSVRPIYYVGALWYGPSIFANTHATCDDLPDGRIRQSVEILEPYRDCDAFFVLVRGVLRGTPSVLGLPEARVEMVRAPRRATYFITPPRQLTIWGRLRRMLSRNHVLQGALQELTLFHEELSRSHQELARQSQRLRDEIAERKRAEHRLREAQKMEAVGRLAGGLAHELNNALTAINGFAELAADAVGVGHEARQDVEHVIAEVARASTLIQQVLAFSRRQVLHPARVDLNATLAELAPMLRRLLGEPIELAIACGEDLGSVLIDRGQLEQILINLLVNARDALPRGGHVKIITSVMAGGPEGGRVCLEVRDDGVGMDENTRSQAFEPFFTTKPVGRGSGLGLSTVYGIVEQSGGRVGLESRLGHGTRVRIELPRVAGAPDPPARAIPEPRLPRGKELVLLVEDEDSVRRVARRVLEGRGYTVLEAPDAEAALALVTRHEGPIDLVVTDVVMPGIDGRELARHLAHLRPELRGVIYVSGHAEDAIGSEGSLPLERAFLRKPFSASTLLAAVRRALDA